jgi:hypothetical protein
VEEQLLGRVPLSLWIAKYSCLSPLVFIIKMLWRAEEENEFMLLMMLISTETF